MSDTRFNRITARDKYGLIGMWLRVNGKWHLVIERIAFTEADHD